MNTDILIVGAGPAGLAAAVAAKRAGVDDILIVERDKEPGGILNQCIHNGFGLHTFKEELTGPEYAARFIAQAEEAEIPLQLETIVVDISLEEDGVTKAVTCMNKTEGLFVIYAKAVILAMGCRERPRGALNIPGYRPAGIYSAGTAQHYVNVEGKMPGKEVVILGSGDIGLIMARRMTLEGAKVKVVAELMPYSGGLKRNIVQCLDDYGIPLKLSHTVVDIHGKERVEGVTLAKVDEQLKPIPGTEEYIACDTLLLSCGLIPENELSQGLGVEMNPVTSGPIVNESLETTVPGVFACGNVLHVHDLVDYVSEEASKAGQKAAAFLIRKVDPADCPEKKTCGKNEKSNDACGTDKQMISIRATDGVRYTVPTIIRPEEMDDLQVVRFRVGNVYKNRNIAVYFDDELQMKLPKKILAPGEMEQVILKKKDLLEKESLQLIRICIE